MRSRECYSSAVWGWHDLTVVKSIWDRWLHWPDTDPVWLKGKLHHKIRKPPFCMCFRLLFVWRCISTTRLISSTVATVASVFTWLYLTKFLVVNLCNFPFSSFLLPPLWPIAAYRSTPPKHFFYLLLHRIVPNLTVIITHHYSQQNYTMIPKYLHFQIILSLFEKTRKCPIYFFPVPHLILIYNVGQIKKKYKRLFLFNIAITESGSWQWKCAVEWVL